MRSDPPILNQTREMFKGTVVGALRIIGEAASGQLAAFQMRANAITTNSFFGAGIVCTVASLQVFLFVALHLVFLSHRLSGSLDGLPSLFPTRSIAVGQPASLNAAA